MGKGIRMHGCICLLLLGWAWGLLGGRNALAQANLEETMRRQGDVQGRTACVGRRCKRQTGTEGGCVTAPQHAATPVSPPLYRVVPAVPPGAGRLLNAQSPMVQPPAS